ncbi:hypothetical protein J6590_050333 [Homalodisca vitripennis]|nr:hypothetical protein J6590_050333 [Homalodisca vitripennis]
MNRVVVSLCPGKTSVMDTAAPYGPLIKITLPPVSQYASTMRKAQLAQCSTIRREEPPAPTRPLIKITLPPVSQYATTMRKAQLVQCSTIRSKETPAPTRPLISLKRSSAVT